MYKLLVKMIYFKAVDIVLLFLSGEESQSIKYFLNYCFYFWDNSIITSPPLFSLHCPFHIPFLACSFKIKVSSHSLMLYVCICIWLYKYIPKFNLLSLYSFIWMHVFRAELSVWENRLVCSSKQERIQNRKRILHLHLGKIKIIL